MGKPVDLDQLQRKSQSSHEANTAASSSTQLRRNFDAHFTQQGATDTWAAQPWEMLYHWSLTLSLDRFRWTDEEMSSCSIEPIIRAHSSRKPYNPSDTESIPLTRQAEVHAAVRGAASQIWASGSFERDDTDYASGLSITSENEWANDILTIRLLSQYEDTTGGGSYFADVVLECSASSDLEKPVRIVSVRQDDPIAHENAIRKKAACATSVKSEHRRSVSFIPTLRPVSEDAFPDVRNEEGDVVPRGRDRGRRSSRA